MAKRRMFSLQIVDTDAFLEMPMSTQLLYFHLVMRADDEGFVDSPKKIMRLIGMQDDDLKVLVAKRFVLTFDSGIIVIKHWLIHNTIRMDRFHKTSYQEERKSLKIKENKSYTEVGKPNGNQMVPQVKLSKDKLSKVNNTKVLEQSSGREDINKIINHLKDKLGTSLDGTQRENRNYANLLIKRFKKDYPEYNTVEQITYLIDYGLRDNFHAKNITNIKYLYYNAQKIIKSLKVNTGKVVKI